MAKLPIGNMHTGHDQAALGTGGFHGINISLETGMSSDSELHKRLAGALTSTPDRLFIGDAGQVWRVGLFTSTSNTL